VHERAEDKFRDSPVTGGDRWQRRGHTQRKVGRLPSRRAAAAATWGGTVEVQAPQRRGGEVPA
jgi:hypothetical protein